MLQQKCFVSTFEVHSLNYYFLFPMTACQLIIFVLFFHVYQSLSSLSFTKSLRLSNLPQGVCAFDLTINFHILTFNFFSWVIKCFSFSNIDCMVFSCFAIKLSVCCWNEFSLWLNLKFFSLIASLWTYCNICCFIFKINCFGYVCCLVIDLSPH